MHAQYEDMDAELQRSTVHRLEAFSDIVIGFGLAQLGASLTFDRTMTLDASGVFAFLGAFAIICSLWYFHHHLFEKFFVPKGLPVVLNFLWLAVVVLLVFVAVQFRTGFEHRNLDLTYFGLYAVAYGILAIQTIAGVRLRPEATAELRAGAARNVTFMALWSLIFIVCFAWVFVLRPTQALGVAINATFITGAAVTVVLARHFRRRKAALANA